MKSHFNGKPVLNLTGRPKLIPTAANIQAERDRAATAAYQERSLVRLAALKARYPHLSERDAKILEERVSWVIEMLNVGGPIKGIEYTYEILRKVADLLPAADSVRRNIEQRLLVEAPDDRHNAMPIDPGLHGLLREVAALADAWSPVKVVHVRDEPTVDPIKVGDRVSFTENGRKVVGEVVREGGGGLVAVLPDGAMVAALKRPEGLTREASGGRAAMSAPPARAAGSSLAQSEPRPTRGNRAGANDDKIAAALQAGVKNALADIFG
jgi:hypothetical protein